MRKPRRLRCFIQPMPAVNGMIHNARISFTVVAICNATTPYFCAAPATELVSWMAIAAQKPNCSCVNDKSCPIQGKTTSATAFKINTVIRATAISSSRAFITGAVAAIALPPQIAVPTETNAVVRFGRRNKCPQYHPAANVTTTDPAASHQPAPPACKAAVTGTPKPRPAIETCKSNRVIRALCCSKG